MFACILALAVVAATPAIARLAITDKTMGKSTPRLELNVHYPVTGRPAIDKLFADYVRARIAEVGKPEAGEDHEYFVVVAFLVLCFVVFFFCVGFVVVVFFGG